jgi:hypothetical protein
MTQCKGIKSNGKRCSRECKSGKFCYQHKSLDSKSSGKRASKKSPDYSYDKKSGRLIVNRIKRVHHDKLTGLPLRYTRGLTPKERIAYKKEIQRTLSIYKKTGKVVGRKPESFRTSGSRGSKETYRRSSHAVKFEKCYGFKVTDLKKVKAKFSDTDVDGILAKGRAAYASGSRPNRYGRAGVESWSYARLASVLTKNKALLVDKDLVGPKSLKIIMKQCK